MGTQMSVETGAKSAIPLRCAPNSQPFRNCSSDKSGSFAEAEAYHSFYRKLAQRHFNPRAPEGCNTPVYFSLCSMRCFNPRAPRGARLSPAVAPSMPKVFQPTRPARGATAGIAAPVILPAFQPTRPARGATGRDGSVDDIGSKFQPTRPARGATELLGSLVALEGVSTHAPREGRDRQCLNAIWQRSGFNPRAPRGARPALSSVNESQKVFQPTRPARGATAAGIVRR